jgi:hypothetical protein
VCCSFTRLRASQLIILVLVLTFSSLGQVEKQHHLVEKFKAAKTRAQNAINDWNHTNPDQDL